MSKILIRLPRKRFVEELGRDVLLGKFEKHLVKDVSKPFHEKKSSFSVETLQGSAKRFVQGKESYLLFDADWLDSYKQLKRLAQIISLKDIGRIITLLGITKDSVVIESGAGSGAATSYLGMVAKEVHSYEVDKEHLEVAKHNVEVLGVDNVFFHLADIYDVKNVQSHGADAFLLDVPDPKEALASVEKALRIGGRAVIYSPNLTQVQSTVLSLPEGLLYESTIELTERQWSIRDKVLRPVMQGLGHTAFLTLVRKVPILEEKE